MRAGGRRNCYPWKGVDKLAEHTRKSRKKTFGILGAVGGMAVGAAAFAFAAGGTATVTQIVTASDEVAACDIDGYVVELGQPTWSQAQQDYTVSQVEVTGLDVTAAGCGGQTMQIDILDGTGASIAFVEHAIVTDTDPGTLALSQAVNGQAVEGMATVIYAPQSP